MRQYGGKHISRKLIYPNFLSVPLIFLVFLSPFGNREAGNEAGRISHSEVPGPLSSPRGGQRKFRGYWVKKVDNFTFIFPIPYKTTKRKRHKTRESPLIRNYEDSLIFLRTSSCSCYQLFSP